MASYYLSAQQAARRLGVCRVTIYRYLSSGVLRGVRVGPKKWRISEDEVRRVLSGGELIP